MAQEKNIKALAFDWVFKGLIAVVCFLVKDMHGDVKLLMQTMPVLRAEVDNLKDKWLMDKFKSYRVPMKPEEDINYDSLMNKK
jgi:hypothetical protein